MKTLNVGGFVPFGVPSYFPEEGWAAQFAPGAFTRAIRRNQIGLLLNHRAAGCGESPCLASTIRDTLHAWQSDEGLWFRADILDSEHVQLLSTFQRRGQLNGVSLSWRLGTENSRYERIQSSVWSWAFAIVEADLFEISICAGDYRPAIPGTWLQVKDATVSGRQPRSSGGRRELRRIGGVLVEIEYHDFADRSIPATIRTVPNSGIPGIFVRECGG